MWPATCILSTVAQGEVVSDHASFDSLFDALTKREAELREQEIALRRKLIDAEIERCVLTHERLLNQLPWECAKLPLARRVDIVLGIYSLIRDDATKYKKAMHDLVQLRPTSGYQASPEYLEAVRVAEELDK